MNLVFLNTSFILFIPLPLLQAPLSFFNEWLFFLLYFLFLLFKFYFFILLFLFYLIKLLLKIYFVLFYYFYF